MFVKILLMWKTLPLKDMALQNEVLKCFFIRFAQEALSRGNLFVNVCPGGLKRACSCHQTRIYLGEVDESIYQSNDMMWFWKWCFIIHELYSWLCCSWFLEVFLALVWYSRFNQILSQLFCLVLLSEYPWLEGVRIFWGFSPHMWHNCLIFHLS